MQARHITIKQTNEQIALGFKNCLKCSFDPAEKEEHRTVKFWLANYCWQHKISFMTEAVFKNNQRADFVILQWGIAIEVLSSEQHLKNTKKYPLPVIPFKIQPCVSGALMFELVSMLDDLRTTNGNLVNYYIKKYHGVGQRAKV